MIATNDQLIVYFIGAVLIGFMLGWWAKSAQVRRRLRRFARQPPFE